MARIAVVTGSNQGIGFGIVRRLLKDEPSWTVYLTARSEERGRQAVSELEKEGLKPHFHQLDICDVESIKRLKTHLVDTHGGLDVLVNNAGVAYKTASTAPKAEKAEVTVTTNVFGTMDVCRELVPILRDSARVVILSSMTVKFCMPKLRADIRAKVQRRPPLKLDEIKELFQQYVSDAKLEDITTKGWADDSAYSFSKVGNALTSMAYQEIFNSDSRKDLVVNTCCPGYVNTNMTSHKGHKTIDEGADTPSYLAMLPPNTDIKGKFFSERKQVDWLYA